MFGVSHGGRHISVKVQGSLGSCSLGHAQRASELGPFLGAGVGGIACHAFPSAVSSGQAGVGVVWVWCGAHDCA